MKQLCPVRNQCSLLFCERFIDTVMRVFRCLATIGAKLPTLTLRGHLQLDWALE